VDLHHAADPRFFSVVPPARFGNEFQAGERCTFPRAFRVLGRDDDDALWLVVMFSLGRLLVASVALAQLAHAASGSSATQPAALGRGRDDLRPAALPFSFSIAPSPMALPQSGRPRAAHAEEACGDPAGAGSARRRRRRLSFPRRHGVRGRHERAGPGVRDLLRGARTTISSAAALPRPFRTALDDALCARLAPRAHGSSPSAVLLSILVEAHGLPTSRRRAGVAATAVLFPSFLRE
jgi:hypothetical protein